MVPRLLLACTVFLCISLCGGMLQAVGIGAGGRWEYLCTSVDDTAFESQMNSLGRVGWELVSARRGR
jgi:hypothetical protein